MAEHERGQVERGAAVVYDEFFVPALFGRFTESIADLAQVGPRDSVVDVACGTGALTRSVRARTDGNVVGVDVSPDMLVVARRRSTDIVFEEADAVSLPFRSGQFDVAVSQFGVMFFSNPSAGAAEMARVAERGLVAVWGSIERSDGYSEMQQLFRDELGADAASSLDAPFAMGMPGSLEAVIAEAGIDEAVLSEVQGTGRFASIAEWVTTEVRGWTLGESVTDDQLSALIAIAEDRLARFRTADGCVFGIGARVATWG